MWRGFAVGTLAVVVLYALLQDRAVGAVDAGTSWGLRGVRRLLSPDVAGIPQLRSARSVPISPSMPGRKLPTTEATPFPGKGQITV